MSNAMLQANDLSFSYGKREAIQRVSLSLHSREVLGLIGPNGSGKTTLLKLLAGILPSPSCPVLYGKRALNSFSRRELSRHITFVSQEMSLSFPFTVREVVALGRTPYLGRFAPETAQDKIAIETALQETDLSELAERPLATLSGGEQKRAFLARAFAQQANIVLLDEPTSNLDLHYQLQIMKLITQMQTEGRSIIVALHDLTLAARFCSRLILLTSGQLIADGSPEEVLTEANLSKYFQVTAQVQRFGDHLQIVPFSFLF